jgi:DNA-binding transcriptional ArsR family regulator
MPGRKRMPHPVMSDDALELVAARFRVLGDGSRLRLLNMLMQGEASVQNLVEASGLSQTNVSRHLGLLRRERLVVRTRVGNRALYRVSDPSVEKLCRIVCGGIGDQLAGGLDALNLSRGT